MSDRAKHLYRPSAEVNLWEMTREDIASLTPGQWCYCGTPSAEKKRCRYYKTVGGVHWVAHWNGEGERWSQFSVWAKMHNRTPEVD